MNIKENTHQVTGLDSDSVKIKFINKSVTLIKEDFKAFSWLLPGYPEKILKMTLELLELIFSEICPGERIFACFTRQKKI